MTQSQFPLAISAQYLVTNSQYIIMQNVLFCSVTPIQCHNISVGKHSGERKQVHNLDLRSKTVTSDTGLLHKLI